MSTDRFGYTLFGLRVISEIQLPELLPADVGEASEVTIRVGTVVAPSSEPGFSSAGAAKVLNVPGVARYLVSDGRWITVDPVPGALSGDIRLFLLGSAFGALLLQRALLPLHANAIEMDGGAVAFMGPSGIGKSTLAAWFHDSGFPVLADDVCVVRAGTNQRSEVLPGLPRLRLHKDALAASGRRADRYQRSFPSREDLEKFDVPIPASATSSVPRELRAIYLVQNDEQFSIARLCGIEAMDALFANTYRGQLLAEGGMTRSHFLSCCTVLKHTPIYSLRRARGFADFDEQNWRILHHARESLQ
jgi:hypothetical protein